MDVMKPQVVWVEGRCYRVDDPMVKTLNATGTYQEDDLYKDDYGNFEEENEDEETFDVEQLGDSLYRTTFHVPKNCLGAIIGKKGAIISQLKKETNTNIKTPKMGQSKSDVVIQGNNAANVKTARRRINNIIKNMKQRPTHFISIPLNKSQIVENFMKFKDAVLKEGLAGDVDERVFVSGGRLHLTLGVLSLADQAEREAAAAALMEAREKILLPMFKAHKPFQIRVRGLSYMNDDPKEVHVLYAKVETTGGGGGGLLDDVARALVDQFDKIGMMDKRSPGNNVKLHATLMNSRHAAREGGGRRPFDASRLLTEFADYEFGVADLTEVHLSTMHCDGVDYYPAVAVASVHS